jgi:predicted cupin superfamily sugar epimerase
MTKEISYWVEKLGLLPHPEGGFYKETYRSVENAVGKDRQLMTAIYFLLTSDNVSKFHRIKSDEIWYFHAGSPLIVHMLDENGHTENHIGLALELGQQPQFLVPKETIFGSSVLHNNSYSLVSCTVAPGFDFADFELFSASDLLPLFPECKEIIERLT